MCKKADCDGNPRSADLDVWVPPVMYTLGFLLTQLQEKKTGELGWAAWAGDFFGVLGNTPLSWERLLKVGTTAEHEAVMAHSIFKTVLAPLLMTEIHGAFPAFYYFAKRAARQPAV